MIKKIKLTNFRGIDNCREISFEANAKRKADKSGITKINGREILLSVGLLGKNASGKTSFVEGINFIEEIASGFFYKRTMHHLEYVLEKKWKKEQKINMQSKVNKQKINVKFKEVIDYIRKEEFNDPTKAMKFLIEFIDAKNFIKLNINLSVDGTVKEIIEQNNKIIFKQEVSLQEFKSKIYDKKLIFKKVDFERENFLSFWHKSFWWIDPLIFKNKMSKNNKFDKNKFLKWIRIADEKIKKIIWTSKGEIEGFIITNNNSDKKISWSELSSGTQKWIKFSFLFFKVLFFKQTFIIIDEIERSIHPSLVKFLIVLINDMKVNKQKSQLLFTSHCPLAVDIPFRKDAINYIDKVGKIVNLGNLGIREDINFSKNFLSEKLSSHPAKSDMFEFISDFYV